MQTIDKQNQQIRFRTLSRIWKVLTLTTMRLTLEQLSFRPLARILGVLTKTYEIIRTEGKEFPSPLEDYGGSNSDVAKIEQAQKRFRPLAR